MREANSRLLSFLHHRQQLNCLEKPSGTRLWAANVLMVCSAFDSNVGDKDPGNTDGKVQGTNMLAPYGPMNLIISDLAVRVSCPSELEAPPIKQMNNTEWFVLKQPNLIFRKEMLHISLSTSKFWCLWALKNHI